MKIEYFDTTMRDGAQSLPETNQFPVGSKPEIAESIASLGVNTIEAGFPATPSDAEEVIQVADIIGNRQYKIEPTFIDESGSLVAGETYTQTPVITGLSRSVLSDIETTWSAVASAENPGIHVFVSTDDMHMKVKHKDMTPDEVVHMGVEAVRYANEISSPDTRIEFSAEAASTTDPDFLDRVIAEVLQYKVDVINLPDTIGQARPIDIESMFFRAAKRIIAESKADEVTLSAHNHNDSGLAIINSVAAAQGVKKAYSEVGFDEPDVFQVEGCIGGLGERAGNVALEQVVNYVNGHGEEDGLWQSVDTRKVLPVAESIFSIAGLEIPRQAPIIGSDILRHRSGIHSDGVIKGGAGIYTPFDPRWFGHQEAGIIEDGKYQGKRGANSLGAINEY